MYIKSLEKHLMREVRGDMTNGDSSDENKNEETVVNGEQQSNY